MCVIWMIGFVLGVPLFTFLGGIAVRRGTILLKHFLLILLSLVIGFYIFGLVLDAESGMVDMVAIVVITMVGCLLVRAYLFRT